MFDFTAKMICNYDESKTPEKLRENYSAFLSGLISFPLNIPGTSYWKCLKVTCSVPQGTTLGLKLKSFGLLSIDRSSTSDYIRVVKGQGKH